MFFRAIFIIPIVSLLVLANPKTCKNLHQLPQRPICPGPPGVWIVEPSNGKGLGVFAVRDLEIGDIVMRETPIIKIQPPKVAKGSPYPMSAVSKLVRAEFEALSPEEKEDVLSLTYHTSAAESDGTDKLGIIFRTNAYNTGDKVGLFPKIARINHSCRPNTSYYWSEKLNKRIVYATRKIKQGEEFFVSYISLLQTHQERQKQLDRYGFKCSCEACAQNHTTMEASDDRRTSIKKAFTDFEPQLTLTPPKSKSAKQQARKNANASLELAKLVQQEGLADYYAKAYRIAAISHARVEDWQPAAIWANKGYELRYIEDPQSQSTLELATLTTTFIEKWEQALKNPS